MFILFFSLLINFNNDEPILIDPPGTIQYLENEKAPFPEEILRIDLEEESLEKKNNK